MPSGNNINHQQNGNITNNINIRVINPVVIHQGSNSQNMTTNKDFDRDNLKET